MDEIGCAKISEAEIALSVYESDMVAKGVDLGLGKGMDKPGTATIQRPAFCLSVGAFLRLLRTILPRVGVPRKLIRGISDECPLTYTHRSRFLLLKH